jgi:hypothetical protein
VGENMHRIFTEIYKMLRPNHPDNLVVYSTHLGDLQTPNITMLVGEQNESGEFEEYDTIMISKEWFAQWYMENWKILEMRINSKGEENDS